MNRGPSCPPSLMVSARRQSGKPSTTRAALHSIHTPWSTYLWALTTLSLSRDPLTDVCRAIPKLDAIRFTALEKTDSLSIHEGQLEQVQNDPSPVRLRAEERLQVAHVLSVQSTAHFEDDLPVRVPGDPKHLSLPNDFAGIVAKVRRSPECMAIQTPPRTD